MAVYQRIDSVTARDAITNPNIADDLAATAAAATATTADGGATVTAATTAAAGGGDAGGDQGGTTIIDTDAASTSANSVDSIITDIAAGAATTPTTPPTTTAAATIDTTTTIFKHKTQQAKITEKTAEDGLVFRHSGYSKKNEYMNATRIFYPPCTTVVRYHEKNKGITSMLLYFVPTRPGGCNHMLLLCPFLSPYSLTTLSHDILSRHSHDSLSCYLNLFTISSRLPFASSYHHIFTLLVPFYNNFSPTFSPPSRPPSYPPPHTTLLTHTLQDTVVSLGVSFFLDSIHPIHL